MDLLIPALAALLLAVTLLPLSGTHHWWVRIWDFPRIQIALGLALVLALALAFLSGPILWIVAVPTVAGMALHLHRIRPFTPLARREMRLAPRADDGSEVTLLAANVLMENDRFDLLLDLIRAEDPDVLLLMETDERWIAAMAPVLAAYPTILTTPGPPHYGMVLATRLAVVDARLMRLTDDETPTAFAELRTPGGTPFRFVGLHPEPPVPGVDTDERDVQLLYAARFARRSGVPVVVMGDFNDAAWSDTARLFKDYGRYLDPRIGRGLYASFHANNPLIRCAIDQLYVTDDVAMESFRLGPRIGSDHFPVMARVRVGDGVARGLNRTPEPLTDEEQAEIEARLAEYARRFPHAALTPGA